MIPRRFFGRGIAPEVPEYLTRYSPAFLAVVKKAWQEKKEYKFGKWVITPRPPAWVIISLEGYPRTFEIWTSRTIEMITV